MGVLHDAEPPSGNVCDDERAGSGREIKTFRYNAVDDVFHSTQIFTCCDGVYFQKYGKAFLASVNVNSPGAKVVVHILDPHKGYSEDIEHLASYLNAMDLTVIVSGSGLEAEATPQQKAAFYANHRFVALSEYIVKSPKITFFLDVDSCIRSDLLQLYNQYEKCDVAVHTRLERKLESRRLLCGAILFDAQNKIVRDLIGDIAKRVKGNREWYHDQVSVYRALVAFAPRLRIAQLEKIFIDWDFGDASVVWTGKGERKDTDAKYTAYITTLEDLYVRRPDVCILLPKMDCGYKQGTSSKLKSQQKRRKDPVRIYWHYFAKIMADALEAQGVNAEIIVRPNWEFTREFIAALPHGRIFVPHRTKRQIEDPRCLFYMQELYPFYFSVDTEGWAASASSYGSLAWQQESGTDARTTSFIENIKAGRITKYKQDTTPVDNEYDVFFPLQIPQDETLLFHSPHTLQEIMQAVIAWANISRVRVLFKKHPYDPDAAYLTPELLDSEYVTLVAGGDIHDYIEKSKCVFTANSGVGFETLIYGKPLVTFAHAIYDGVAHKAGLTPEGITAAYEAALSEDASARSVRYRQFIQWYLFKEGNLLDTDEIGLNLKILPRFSYRLPYRNELNRLLGTIKLKFIKDLKAASSLRPSLQPNKKKKAPSIVNSMLSKAKMFYFMHLHPRVRFKFFAGKTVALVGNGASLYGQGLGEEIDGHDIVIRFNVAHPYTLRKDVPLTDEVRSLIVGTFTDRRVVPSEEHHLLCEELSAEQLCAYTNIRDTGKKTTVWSCATADKERQRFYRRFFKKCLMVWPHTGSFKNIHMGLLKGKFRTLHPKYYELFSEEMGIEPSSGMLMFEYLRSNQRIKKISLYGFDFFASGHMHRKNQLLLEKRDRFPHSKYFERDHILSSARRDGRISIFPPIEDTFDYPLVPKRSTLVFNVSKNFYALVRHLLWQNRDLQFYAKKKTKLWDIPIAELQEKNIVIYSYMDPETEAFIDAQKLQVVRMEDGFLHSVTDSPHSIMPYSWVFDREGLYFNGSRPSGLENVLQNLSLNDAQREYAQQMLSLFIESGLTKYNMRYSKTAREVLGPKGSRKRIVIFGQIEDDKSILYGLEKRMTNNDLVKLAREENPDAEIFYKPHPYIVSNIRTSDEYSNPEDVKAYATIVYDKIPTPEILEEADHVYVMTSTTGFEAVLRGIRTTVMGASFYSNWGLTDDRQIVDRRTNRLTVAEIFYGVFMCYPYYMLQNRFVDFQTVLTKMKADRNRQLLL